MKLFRSVGAIFLFTVCTSFYFHPHHVEVVEVSFNAGQKELQIAGKWFVDDLEEAIRKKYKVSKDLVQTAESLPKDSLVMEYFRSHLLFSGNHQPLDLNCIGAEHEKGDIWLYFVVKGYDSSVNLTCRPTVLCDVLKDQSHIVHFVNGNKRASYKSNCLNPLIRHKW